jgi:hypothetical protein
VKDLPDHVNESEIHFSSTPSLPSAISPWYTGVRMERYDSHAGYMISTTRVVTAVIELRLIDTASETVGCLSSPIEYTIENSTDTMQVEGGSLAN